MVDQNELIFPLHYNFQNFHIFILRMVKDHYGPLSNLFEIDENTNYAIIEKNREYHLINYEGIDFSENDDTFHRYSITTYSNIEDVRNKIAMENNE